MNKPHYKPTNTQLAVNKTLRRLPFYAGGAANHLHGTKHSKAWSDFGWPISLDFWFYWGMYKRLGLAGAGIERPSDMCFMTQPMIKVDEDNEDAVHKELAQRLDLWGNFHQLDYMQRVGHYAGLIIRVADGERMDQPMSKTTMDRIVSVTPAWEGQLQPAETDNDSSSIRYGLPTYYQYHANGVRNSHNTISAENERIHWSRVLIWNEGAAGNTIYGTSSLERPYNALIDWEKVRGAGAEGYWKKAAMRSVLQALPGVEGQAPGQDLIDQLAETITELQNSFDSVPYLGGMELKSLGDAGAMGDPSKSSEIALQDAAAGFKWSAKGLIGAQEGRLAGDQDSSLDKQSAQSRRENFLSRMFRNWLNWLGEYTEYDAKGKIIEWDDLLAASDEQRLENMAKMADINYKHWQARGVTLLADSEMREIGGWKEPKPEDDNAMEEFDRVEPVEEEQA